MTRTSSSVAATPRAGGESDADTRSSEQDDSLGSLRDFVANDDSEVEQASSSESEPEDSDCSADDSEDSVDDIECTEQEDEDETSIDTDDSAEAGRGRKRRAVKKKKPHTTAAAASAAASLPRTERQCHDNQWTIRFASNHNAEHISTPAAAHQSSRMWKGFVASVACRRLAKSRRLPSSCTSRRR